MNSLYLTTATLLALISPVLSESDFNDEQIRLSCMIYEDLAFYDFRTL